ncbi:MAG TPA: RNA polymerase sigma factor SigZ [bacterium]|nr:RNA polymerase sigma factor SigZ [bacterium]HPN42116.1 RNA polymerase sigma factor SigZ [bacterium]
MPPTTESIWQACSQTLKVFIQRRTNDPTLADDILQDVFIKVHNNIAGVKDEQKICSWLYQITRNTIIDYYRKHKKLEGEPLPEIPDCEEPDTGAADEVANGLKDMVMDLPEMYAQALLQVEFAGLTQKEYALKTGISVSGAKSRVQRARQMLKDNLMRCCHFEFDHYGTIIDSCPACCCCKN